MSQQSNMKKDGQYKDDLLYFYKGFWCYEQKCLWNLKIPDKQRATFFNSYTSLMCLFFFFFFKQVISLNRHFYQAYRWSSVTALSPQGKDKSSPLSHVTHTYSAISHGMGIQYFVEAELIPAEYPEILIKLLKETSVFCLYCP